MKVHIWPLAQLFGHPFHVSASSPFGSCCLTTRLLCVCPTSPPVQLLPLTDYILETIAAARLSWYQRSTTSSTCLAQSPSSCCQMHLQLQRQKQLPVHRVKGRPRLSFCWVGLASGAVCLLDM